jgi:hypothetical protein
MRHLKALGVALIAMCAFGLTTSALATLPDLSKQLVGPYPIHLLFGDNKTTLTNLKDTGGNLVMNTGLLLSLLQSELSALGKFEALFLHVEKGLLCEQTGRSNVGELLTKGTYHLVYPSLTPLTLGIAFLVEPVSFNCEKVKIKVEGCALGQITDPLSASQDVALMTATLLGDKKGKNILTEYDNAAGTAKVKCILLADFGVEFMQAEEAVEEPIHLTTLEEKMFSISPI